MLGSLEYLLPSSFFLKENLKSSISKTHTLVVSLSQWVLNFYLFFFYGKSFSTIFFLFFFLLRKCFVQGSQYHTRSYFSLIKGTKYFSIVQHQCTVARLSLFLLYYTIYKVISLWKLFISPKLSTYKCIKVKTIK